MCESPGPIVPRPAPCPYRLPVRSFSFPGARCHRRLRWQSPGRGFPASDHAGAASPGAPGLAGGDLGMSLSSPELQVQGDRRAQLNVTRCEKLETGASCPGAAGGSQGHVGGMSRRSPGNNRRLPNTLPSPSPGKMCGWSSAADPRGALSSRSAAPGTLGIDLVPFATPVPT